MIRTAPPPYALLSIGAYLSSRGALVTFSTGQELPMVMDGSHSFEAQVFMLSPKDNNFFFLLED